MGTSIFQSRSGQASIDQIPEAMFSPSNSCSERVSNLDSSLGHCSALSAIVTSARVLQQIGRERECSICPMEAVGIMEVISTPEKCPDR